MIHENPAQKSSCAPPAKATRIARPEMALRLAGMAGALALSMTLTAGHGQAAELPGAIAAGGKAEIMRLHAEGVQIYECKADPAGAAKWQFREPLATLLKDGKTVGRHFAGPGWELASGSTVIGKVEAQAPGRNPSDIPLLKLAAAETRGGGELAKVGTIQRLDTHGGMFAGTCDEPGALHLEPYAAEYVFLGE